MTDKRISVQTLRRLPVYLHYLKSISGTRENVSATMIAEAFGLNDVQVRKDLGSVSGSGKPKTGYRTKELLRQIEDCLMCAEGTKLILIGAGHLGQALLSFEGFREYGLTITAAFDRSPLLAGKTVGGRPIFPMEQLEDFCRSREIRLAILTVPAQAAQPICDRLIRCGIKAIWNFAPVILRVPEDVTVENENLASSLAVLTRHLKMPGAADAFI